MESLDPYLVQLKRVPYVKRVRIERETPPADSVLRIRTPAGNFAMTLELRRSYLDRAATNALLALAARRPRLKLMIFARYISRPIGEQLAAARVNFVDRAGNLHLRLGDNQTLLLGKPEGRPRPEAKRTGPAAIQVYATFLAVPEAIQWSTRQVAEASGSGKSAVADARHRLTAEGVLQPLKSGGYALADRKSLEEYFLRGYEQVLRPHLTLGRYRSAERDGDAFVERVAAMAARRGMKWALTGAAGAYELERFYRGKPPRCFSESIASATRSSAT